MAELVPVEFIADQTECTQKDENFQFSSAKQSRRKADTCFAHLFIQFFTICVLATAKTKIYGFETECTHRKELRAGWMLFVNEKCEINRRTHFGIVLFRLM